MNTLQLSNKKIFVFGLLMNCPEGEPMVDCPLEKYRKLSIKERLKYLEKLSDKEIDKINKHHHECVWRRVN